MSNEDIKVKIGGNLTGFNQALKKANKGADTFAKSVAKSAKITAIAFSGLIITAGIMGAKFDKEMRFVGAITKATAKEFKDLTNMARQMGATTEFTANQAAQGLRFLSMAGLDANEAMEALPGALDLATAGSMDLARAADIATNILSQFSLDVSELTRVNDVLAEVQTTANTNIEEAATAFIYAGTMAKMFGMQIEELAGFVGLLANRGIKGSLAGTTLRQSMIKLINPSKEAAEIMERYELVVENADGTLRNFTDVILDMVDAQIGTKDAAILLGARASQLASIFNMTTKEIVDYINNLNAAQGAAKRLADSVRKSFSGKWQAMMSKFMDMMLSFFYTFEKTGLAAFETIGGGFDTLSLWLKDNAQLVSDAFLATFSTAIISANILYKVMAKIVKGYMLIAQAKNVFQANAAYTKEERANKQLAFVDERVKKVGKRATPEFNKWVEATKARYTKERDEAIAIQDEIDENIQRYSDVIDGINISTNGMGKAANLLLEKLKKVREAGVGDISGPPRKPFKRTPAGKPGPKKIDWITENEEMLEGLAANEEAYWKKLVEDEIKAGEAMKAVEKGRTEQQQQMMVDQAKFKQMIAEVGAKVEREIAAETTKKILDEEKKKKEAIKKTQDEIAQYTSNKITDSLMSIIDGTKSVSAAFKDMANSIISDIMRIAIQESISKPVGQAVGTYASGIFANLFHQGGTVGASNIPTRSVPSSIFNNAPRLHDGLSDNEFPAILEKGETVNKKGSSGTSNKNNGVNIIMQNPVFQDLETQRAVFSQIATEITNKVAPSALARDYNNDGLTRSLIRGGR